MPWRRPWDTPSTLLLPHNLRLQRISAAAFTRDLLRLSRLLWHFRHAMSSKRAHSLLSRGLRSALSKSQFSVLMKARRFLRNHSWAVLDLWAGTESCWKIHSWPLKRVMLRWLTTPCSTSFWQTRKPVSPPFLQKWRCVTPWWDTSHQWHRKGNGFPATSEHFPSPHGTFEHKSCCSGVCTAPWWWRFSHLWRGCFRGRLRSATGGDALL